MKTPVVFLCAMLAAASAMAQRPRIVPGLQPIGITQSIDHQFPDALARIYPNGGEARLLVTIRADGELTEWLLTSYSALPFKEQAILAMKELKFSPARLKGETITARSEVLLRFETRGILISSSTVQETVDTLMRHPLERREVYRAFAVSELDRVPAALHTVTPRYPQELADRGVNGSVTVDFYIDEEGAVRMASVLEQEPFPLAYAAVNAIRQWKFEPPVRGGKTVLAQARQVFNFGDVVAATARR